MDYDDLARVITGGLFIFVVTVFLLVLAVMAGMQ